MWDVYRSGNPRDASGIELRAEVSRLAAHGWPVVSGSEAADLADQEIAGLQRPAGPLFVVTGMGIDAFAVSEQLGRRAAQLLREAGNPTPIIAAAGGDWFFLTSVAGQSPELVRHPEIRLHGAGSRVPLPPTPHQGDTTHWRVRPEVVGWRLPQAEVVQRILWSALYSERSLEVLNGQPNRDWAAVLEKTGAPQLALASSAA